MSLSDLSLSPSAFVYVAGNLGFNFLIQKAGILIPPILALSNGCWRRIIGDMRKCFINYEALYKYKRLLL